jgi:dihydrolipoamide dehydrogenase
LPFLLRTSRSPLPAGEHFATDNTNPALCSRQNVITYATDSLTGSRNYERIRLQMTQDTTASHGSSDFGAQSSHYDVVVLGAGPGGYVAGIRAAQLDLRTAIIEKQYWGGVCLNVGCIPSKALLRNAELAHIVTKEAKAFGISGEARFDFGAAFDRSRVVAEGRVKGVHFLMKKNKITEYDGIGRFIDANTIEVELSKGGTQTVTFDNVIIATGTVTKLLPGVELSANVVTYEEQILTRELPGTILIVGAGAIGMEFAYVLANYGVEVRIVEFLDRALPNEDADVSKEITNAYKKLGVAIQTGAAVESIEDDGSKVMVRIKDYKTDNVETVTFDKVLLAVGFAPRLAGYGLERRASNSMTGAQQLRSTTVCAPAFHTSTPSVT